MPLLPLAHLVISFAAVLAAGTVMGTVSFGMGMVAAPILLLIHDPRTTVIVLNALGALVVGMVLVQTRSHIQLSQALPLTLGGMAAVPVGVRVLSAAGQGPLRLAIAAITLALIVPSAFDVFRSRQGTSTHRHPRLRSRLNDGFHRVVGMLATGARSPWLSPFAGFVGALLVAAFAVGGPLVTIYVLHKSLAISSLATTEQTENGNPTPAQTMSHQPGSVQSIRTTLALFWVVSNGEAVILFWVAGLVTWERLSLTGFLAIPATMGFGVATLLVGKMNERVFRGVTLVMIVVTSLVVMARELADF